MPPFRFNIPFFSYGSPSRPSSGTSSPSPPPTPSRPPFRPGGIAQPSKPATSLETKPKVSPSLSRSKSNVAAIGASSSASQLPSRATPTRLAKQSNQSSSPLKKPESPRAEEQKVATKDKPSRGVEKEAGENMNPVVEKPPIARSEQKEVEEAQEQRKKREVEKLAVVERNSKTTQEQQRKETAKLAAEEKKKLLGKDMEENSKTAQGQQKRKEADKLAAEEKKKVLGKDMEENSKTTQAPQTRKETEQLAVGDNKKVLGNDMEENSKTAQEQQKRKETEEKRKEDERLSAEEEKKVLGKDMEENSKTAQKQQKRKDTEKLGVEERNRALKTVGREDETQSKTTQHIAAASKSTRGPIDLPDGKTQNRTGIHNNDNHQRGKGESASNHGNPGVANREGSSSMSRRIKEDIRDGISKLTWGKSNGDEKSVSVFTLTGENRGATMAIGSEKDKKDGEVHIHRGYRSNPDESPDTTATETEGGTRPFKGKNPKDEDEEDARVKAYVNGNSQGVNNSIVCDSSVQQNDPGIHMSLKFEKSKKKDEAISPPEKKSETVTATEKLKHEPRVRRRCLRGLLAESSESEPENPSKPRRHGCRFTCKDKDIENT